jgi:hypothetical protein
MICLYIPSDMRSRAFSIPYGRTTEAYMSALLSASFIISVF